MGTPIKRLPTDVELIAMDRHNLTGLQYFEERDRHVSCSELHFKCDDYPIIHFSGLSVLTPIFLTFRY